ncbi:siderochrome-iron transporter [Lecanosticta acicola]|uniref:Siderochrome-iron transporter n=1 Tax=Lecanosticta acicola TaxID=111012 RepID=A0AAI9EE23_9PEZI|nr:siderochrome-iron transporter [Lecanosticta acicola]
MPSFNGLRSRKNHTIATGPDPLSNEDFKEADISHDAHSDSGHSSNDLNLYEKNEQELRRDPNNVTSHAQEGIQKAEAAALVWSKKAIWSIYAWIWVCYFLLAFQSAMQSYLTVYAYADFKTSPAISTALILSTIIGGILKVPIAKLINIWGRAEGFAVFVGIYVLGLILLAASSGPSTYAAGYTLYWIGYDAIYLILDIFIADTFGLRNRALAFAFSSTPFIITAFTGSLAANSILGPTGSGWRWGLGLFCIVNLFAFMLLVVAFKFYQIKAEKEGLYKRPSSGRSTWQSIVHYFHEFGVVGCFLLMAAFVLFLLPFSLESYGRAPYGSATFIAMVVIGFCLFFVFAAWEKWFAKVHFIKWELLRERTVVGACLLAAVLYYSFYNWDLNYYNFVLVVYDLDVTKAGYMTQIYNVGSTFWSVLFGVWLRYIRQFKYSALCFGLPLMILGSGLMIYFRGSDQAIGYVVMAQIFIAFAGGTLVISNEMAVMAAADREGVPLMLSYLYLFNSVGGSIGQSVATAIYGNTWSKAVASKLPAAQQNLVSTLYLGGYTVQQTYPPGSVVREAINYGWGRTQYYSCISSTALLVLGFPAILLWRNYRLDKKQNKGTML